MQHTKQYRSYSAHDNRSVGPSRRRRSNVPIIFPLIVIVLLIVSGVRFFGGWFWSRLPYGVQFGGAGDDNATACAVDASGSAYVVGTTNGNIGNKSPGADTLINNIWIARLSPSGSVLWTQQVHSVANEMVGGVAIDSSGNAVVAGSSEGNLFAVNGGAADEDHPHHDVVLFKISQDGSFLWKKQYSARGDEVAQAVAVASDGGILVAGDTDHLLYAQGKPSICSVANGASSNIFLTRYDEGGKQVWGRQWGGPVQDSVDSMTVDSVGSVFVTGSTIGMFDPLSGAQSAFLAKVDSIGTLLWSAQIPNGLPGFPVSVSTDSDGNSYFCSRRGYSIRPGWPPTSYCQVRHATGV